MGVKGGREGISEVLAGLLPTPTPPGNHPQEQMEENISIIRHTACCVQRCRCPCLYFFLQYNSHPPSLSTPHQRCCAVPPFFYVRVVLTLRTNRGGCVCVCVWRGEEWRAIAHTHDATPPLHVPYPIECASKLPPSPTTPLPSLPCLLVHHCGQATATPTLCPAACCFRLGSPSPASQRVPISLSSSSSSSSSHTHRPGIPPLFPPR